MSSAPSAGAQYAWASPLLCACSIDPEGAVTQSSLSFQNLVTGAGRSVVPQQIFPLIHPEDRVSFQADLDRIFQSGAAMERRTVRMVPPDGRVVALEVAGEALSGADGARSALLSWREFEPDDDNQIRAAIGEGTDPFQAYTNQLDEYENVIRNFTSSLFNPVVMVNPEGRIAHANPATLALLGYRSFDLVGRPVAMLFKPRPDLVARAMMSFLKQMRGGAMQERSASWYTRHGDQVPVTMSGSVLRGPGGDLIGMVVVARDERKNAVMVDLEKKNEELVQAYAELKALDRMKDDILSLVGHELRAPLSNILGYSEFLREWKLTEDERQEYVRIIYTESQRLCRLVNDILDLSRMEAGRMTYTYVRDSINRVVDAAVDSLLPEAESRNVRIKLQLDDQLEPLEFDPDRIQQVVTNVVHNAIKFTQVGTTIKVWTEPIEGGTRVSVQDHGVGIDPSDASKVFNKFEQITDVNHHHNGAGLGMPIAKQIVEDGHGGRLWFESDGRGRGAIFTFTVMERRTEP